MTPSRERSDTQVADLGVAYASYCGALERRDLAGVLGHLAPTFQEVTADGIVISLPDAEARLRTWFSEAESVGPAEVTIEALEVTGDEAVVTARRLVFRRARDWFDPTRTEETFDDERLLDTWRLVAGTWLLHRSQRHPRIRGSVESGGTQPIQSPRIAELAGALAAGASHALDAFWAGLDGAAPIVEPVEGDEAHRWVTFVWRARPGTRDVTLAGGLPDHRDKPLARLGETDLWYRTEKLPATTRDHYGFRFRGATAEPHTAPFDAFTSDPLCSRLACSVSFLELPAAPAQPYLVERVGVPRGTLTRHRLASASLGETRSFSVHLPAGFEPGEEGVGLLVVFDGELYGSLPDVFVPTPRIVDNLVAEGRIPRVAALLVDNPSEETRSRDLAWHPPFFEFLARELVPHVRAAYGLSTDPRLTTVAGSSLGGLAAACAGLLHADVFGNVLSQSGSFWYAPDWRTTNQARHEAEPGWVMTAFAESPRLPLRFWMEVGRFEPEDMVLTNRHLRSVLELKGYDVAYTEFMGGHSYACWRGSLADGLISLLGGERDTAGIRP